MDLVKNKLTVGVIVIGVIALLVILLRPNHNLKQDKIMDWITQGYSQQFCSVIFPRLAGCVTLAPKDCIPVASNEIATCVAASKNTIPSSASQAAAKQIYDSFDQCFANKMHDLMQHKYMINTPECQQKLS